jgi:hypothetical protein
LRSNLSATVKLHSSGHNGNAMAMMAEYKRLLVTECPCPASSAGSQLVKPKNPMV